MPTSLLKLLLTSSLLILIQWTNSIANEPARQRILFNKDWLFQKGNNPTARFPETNDRDWREVRLPHDWAIEGPFDVSYNARAGGLPFHGKAWYRKHFSVPANFEDRVVTIEFDGAMNNSKVWINGHFLGSRPNGYIGFAYDLTPFLRYGEDEVNILAVKLAPEDFSSRWYPGAGLYRNVWLDIKNPIHVAHWGTYLTTPQVSTSSAVVNIETTINNETQISEKVLVETSIQRADGTMVATEKSNLESVQYQASVIQQALRVESPTLWDIDNPYLYEAITNLYVSGELVDSYTTPFGIRSINFDNQTGFSLNGKSVAIQGVCMHHDLGPLGAAVNRRAVERQLELLKQMGTNAIRTSHNPPSPEVLEFCDNLGLLIQVEAFDCWEMNKVENGYGKFFQEWHERDLRDMIRRDRNHPSVIMWSIGNEILEQSDKVNGPNIAARLHEICKEEDPTRPTTVGFNYYPAPIENGLADKVDIIGWNYHPATYQEVLDEHPDWIIYGSETASTVSSRGTYHLPVEKYDKDESLEVTSYDLVGPPWAYPPDIEFHFQEKTPQLLGEFMWTGFDYLGEPTPFGGRDNSTNGYWNADWPARSSYFGALDLCGFPKDRFYLYQSVWTKEPMVHILPHWNWEGREGEIIPVMSYTNCDEAELFLNGKSLGKRSLCEDKTSIPVDFYNYAPKTFDSKYRLSWDVPYQKGTLKVVGYIDGKAVCEKEISTSNAPAQISLHPDRTQILSDGYDLSFITVRIEDASGVFCPEANNLVRFQLDGPGEIAAVGNGNPATTESFQSNQRHAFNGLCMLIIRSKPGELGSISISADANGLTQATTTIHSTSM